MIVCPSCKHHNAEDAQTCSACGASLEGFVYRVCPACGALSPAQNTYCHRCLAELVTRSDKPADLVDTPVTPFEPSEPLPAADQADSAPRRWRAAALPSAEAVPVTTEPAAAAEPLEAAQPTPDASAPISPPESAPPQPTEAVVEQQPASAAPTTQGEAEGEAVAPLEIMAPLPEAVVGELVHAEDLLPLEEPVSLPHRAQIPVYAAPGETEQYDAELFRQIATEPASLAEAARVVLPRQARVLSGIGRALLYLLVLLAALTPLVTGGQAIGTHLAIQPSAEVNALAQTLDALPPNAHLLISIDYEPAYAGELDELALAVLRHLASHNANLVIMSTKPAGMGLAERLVRTIASEESAYQTYGEHYALVGYLAGQEAGLRTLTGALDSAFKQDYRQQQPLSQLAVTQNLATLAEFDGIIVLSDDSQAVRRWIEQVHSRTQLPLYALVSARIKPLLVPYARSGQLSALLGGVGEAAEYGVASLGPQRVMAHSDAYVAFLGVLLLVAVITNIAYLARKRASSTTFTDRS